MLQAKIIFIYTVLGVFVAVSIVGIFGATGTIPISSMAVVSALLGPVIGIVATVANAKHIFDDPEAVVNIKREHAELELQRKIQADDSEVERRQRERRFKAVYDSRIKQLEAEVSRWKQAAVVNQDRPKACAPLAPGSATTQK